ncbi:hypothetical protein FXO38_01980 [Capsicum annuum]|nr:hypothetical protein FXO38_01980 [Capsicum annuum]KAF3683085.1 hypothetical protein FXO37_02031 [Capsicum annuum]
MGEARDDEEEKKMGWGWSGRFGWGYLDSGSRCCWSWYGCLLVRVVRMFFGESCTYVCLEGGNGWRVGQVKDEREELSGHNGGGSADYSSIATGEEYDEQDEKEFFKRYNPNDNSLSTEELVKIFSIDRYLVRMQYDGATDLMGDFVVKSTMGEYFDAFRKILQEKKLLAYFRDICFGKYLDLSEDNNGRFQIKMVYELLKRRFMYENKDKMDEAWVFDVIPYLRQQVNYLEEVFCPRILRWLSVKLPKDTVDIESTAEQH